ncbi:MULTISPECIES: hypothetical protein [Corallococcus]|uniref:hypothetical protein n=1 Tax=Corallococcus TaxID=83461 RepID=UPI0011C433E2|nr:MULTISPECIES: hypothetical protein [Corallococcus]
MGLRGLSDQYADALAPDLSNGTVDARWITLLSWCLKASHDVWVKAEGDSGLGSRAAQQRRYAWLRPLELLWVTWTLRAGNPGGRQLRGQRAVRKWLASGERGERFGMPPEQFHRYRQTGLYGAYRTLLRRVPGLTLGEHGPDGWTPSTVVNDLFDHVNRRLPKQARFRDEILENGTQWGRWREREEFWWIKAGWGLDVQGLEELFPTEAGVSKPLPEEERELLRGCLFPKDHRRLVVARVLKGVEPGSRHVDLCDLLAADSVLRASDAGPLLATLPAFTRLADAGMEAMRALWAAIGASDQAGGPEVADLASAPEIQQPLSRLVESSRTWNAREDLATLRAGEASVVLASAMAGARTPGDQLRALARHHELHGGGLRWFRLRRGRVEPLLPQNGAAASPYRFRLWPLARLARQCGVADTRMALEAALSRDEDAPDEGDEA